MIPNAPLLPPNVFNPHRPTRVLFVGGGQDSVALLMLYAHDETFRNQYAPDVNFVAVMSDTGNEFPDTISYVTGLETFCRIARIDFTFVKSEMGFHGRTWPSLTAQMERNSNVMGVAFPKTCTDNLKVKVCYRFLAQWLRDHYGYLGPDPAVYQQYRLAFGKLVTWIGFADGEQSRAQTPVPKPKAAIEGHQTELFAPVDSGPAYIPKWRKQCVSHIYPLLDLSHDRAACQRIIAGYGQPVPMPSNCMFCPFQNLAECVYLFRTQPLSWAYWVEREAAKLAKFSHLTLNLGVKGRLTLPEFLAKALLKYGDWTTEQLREYRFSHGHCVTSKY